MRYLGRGVCHTNDSRSSTVKERIKNFLRNAGIVILAIAMIGVICYGIYAYPAHIAAVFAVACFIRLNLIGV